MSFLFRYSIQRDEPITIQERNATRRGLKVFVVRSLYVKGNPVSFRTCAKNTAEVEGEIEYRHNQALTHGSSEDTIEKQG